MSIQRIQHSRISDLTRTPHRKGDLVCIESWSRLWRLELLRDARCDIHSKKCAFTNADMHALYSIFKEGAFGVYLGDIVVLLSNEGPRRGEVFYIAPWGRYVNILMRDPAEW